MNSIIPTQSMDLIFREAIADKDDSIELTKMYRDLYNDTFSLDSIIPINKNRFLSKIFLAQEEKKEEKSVIGFIWVNYLEFGEARYGYLEELYVKPPFRNRGYGAKLVEQAKAFFRENSVQAVFVSIEKNNDPAIAFYTKCKFKRCEGSWYYFTDQPYDGNSCNESNGQK